MAARSLRRQRNLDQIEIPEDHVMISGDILGKGGFGTVYLADYNGRNAAAKVRVPRRATMGAYSTLFVPVAVIRGFWTAELPVIVGGTSNDFHSFFGGMLRPWY